MHEFLNGFAAAVVTNRTLVWTYTKQGGKVSPGSLNECGALLHRKAWIHGEEVIAGKRVHGFDWHGPGSATDPRRAQKPMACTGLEYAGAEHEVINLGVTEQFESFALAAEDARLSPQAKYRAKLLFAQGPGLAFGTLFRKAFEFDDAKVTEATKKQMRTAALLDSNGNRIPNSYLIGLQIRAKGDLSPSRIAEMFTKSLVEHMNQNHTSDRRCGVLLASDTDHVADIFAPVIAGHNCTMVRSIYDEISTSWSLEHGKHCSAGALRDLDLLSHSDALITSCGSTFSQSCAEQMLSRNPHAALTVIGCGSELQQ